MKPYYLCGGISFETLSLAVEYSNMMARENNVLLGIEEIM